MLVSFIYLDIELEEYQLEYIVLKLFDLSNDIDDLDFHKLFDVFNEESFIELK